MRKTLLPTLSKMRRMNQAHGGHWFDPGTMRFFRTHLDRDGFRSWHSDRVVFALSSEARDETSPRRYSVRAILDGGRMVINEGEFQAYRTRGDATTAAKEAAGSPLSDRIRRALDRLDEDGGD